MMHGFGYGSGYGMGIWMLAFWVIMALVLIIALFGLIAYLKRNDAGASAHLDHNSVNALKVRLARGEVTVEEYNRIKKDLEV